MSRSIRLARTALVLVALAVALAVGAVLGVVATSTTAPAVQPAEVPAVEVPAVEAPDLSYGEPFLVALLGEGTGVPANADELILAADRVCEGMTAGVPMMVLADGIATEFGVSDEEARHFANTAGVVHCAA